MSKLKNLVFSGGGVRGLSFIGCLEALKENKLLDNIVSISGTSMGSIITLGLVLGYTVNEIKKIFLNLDLNKILDINEEHILDYMNCFGVDNGDKFKKVISIIIKKKLNVNSITFEELYEKTKIEMNIIATCINDYKEVIYNYKNTPKQDVMNAIYNSSCVPYYYIPNNIDSKMYVDGGIVNNFPIEIYKDEISNTIGFSLISGEDGIKEITNLLSYTYSMMMCMAEKMNTYKNIKFKKNIVNIVNRISSFDFSVTLEDKQELISDGYNATIKYLQENKDFIYYKIIEDIINEITLKIIEEESNNIKSEEILEEIIEEITDL